MNELSFYQNHLNRVSRSFAFCIEQLESPFREWVSLSYLLCRLVDTVEDSTWDDPANQRLHFEKFGEYLERAPSAGEVEAWIASFAAGAPAEERLLVNDSGRLWGDLHALEPGVRKAIQDSVGYMSEGMLRFHQSRRNGVLRLAGLAEVNEYCYVVAGVVGEMLTRLYAAHKPSFIPDGIILKNACRFGLFLQKVNLLKDQTKDEQEGRFLIPDRREVLLSGLDEAKGALTYLMSLPREEVGYRTFCAWSLFLGLASLATPGGKVSRTFVQPLLTRVKMVVSDNDQLQGLFAEGADRIALKFGAGL